MPSRQVRILKGSGYGLQGRTEEERRGLTDKDRFDFNAPGLKPAEGLPTEEEVKQVMRRIRRGEKRTAQDEERRQARGKGVRVVERYEDLSDKEKKEMERKRDERREQSAARVEERKRERKEEEEAAKRERQERANLAGVSEEAFLLREKQGLAALTPFMEKLMSKPPKDADGNVDIPALFGEIIHANNTLLADKLGLSEEQREQAVFDNEGNIVAPSVMGSPIITTPILRFLDAFESAYPELADERAMQESDIDETLEDIMKRGRVRDDFSSWVTGGVGNSKVKSNLAFYLTERSAHPIMHAVKGLDMVGPRGRVQRDVGIPQFSRDFQEARNREANEARRALADATFGDDDDTFEPRVRGPIAEARDTYGELFSDPRFSVLQGSKGSGIRVTGAPSSEVTQWKKRIQDKMDEGSVDERTAVRQVQEDVDKYMRVFLQNDAVGSTGRGSGRHAPGETVVARESAVSPAFAQAAKDMGVTTRDDPNMADKLLSYFLRGDEPYDEQNRSEAFTYLQDNYDKGQHKTLTESMYGVLMDAAERQGIDTGDLMLDRDAIDPNLAASGGSAEEVAARGAEASRQPGTEATIFTDATAQRAMLARRERQSPRMSRANQQMLDLENMLSQGTITPQEFDMQKSRILSDDSYEVRPFEDDSTGADYAEDHPWRNASEDQIRQKSDAIASLFFGAHARVFEFNKALQLKGLDPEDFNFNIEDISNMQKVMDGKLDMSTLSKEDQDKYQQVFDSGMTRSQFSHINHQIRDFEEKLAGLHISPREFIAEVTTASGNSLTPDGINRAFSSLLQRGGVGADDGEGGRFVRMDRARALRDIQSAIERRAESQERHRRRGEQHERFREHHNSEDGTLEDTETCEGCHPDHFSVAAGDAKRARRMAPYRGFRRVGEKSAFVHKDVMVPDVTGAFDVASGRNIRFPLLPQNDGRTSVGEIAHYLFGGSQSLEDYAEKMQQDIKQKGAERVKRDIERQVRRSATKADNPRMQLVGKKFGLRSIRRKTRGVGHGMADGNQRRAHGVVLPSSFKNNDAMRAQLANQELVSRQFGGINAGLELVRALKSGEIPVEGDVDSMLDSRGTRAELVSKIFDKTSASSRRDNLLKNAESLRRHLAPIFKEYQRQRRAFQKTREQMSMVRQADGSYAPGALHEARNPDGHRAALAEQKRIEDEARDAIATAFEEMDEGVLPLTAPAEAGSRELLIDRDAHRMVGYRSGKSGTFVRIGPEDGDIRRIIDIKAARGRNQLLVLDKPLTKDVPEGEIIGAADEDFTASVRSRLGGNGFIRAAFDKNMSHRDFGSADAFFEALEKKVRDDEKKLNRLSSNANIDARVNSYAMGALVQAGHALNELSELDGEELIEGLKRIYDDLYTKEGREPAQYIFGANGDGSINFDRQFIPDEFMTGKLGESLGSGLTYEHNNRHPLPISDTNVMLAMHQSLRGQVPSEAMRDELDSNVLMGGDFSAKMLNDIFGVEIMPEDEEEDLSSEELDAPTLPEDRRRKQIIAGHIGIEELKKARNNKDLSPGEAFGITPTACGTCGGHGSVPLMDAVDYIRHSNPEMRHAAIDSQKMQTYIAEHLRPPGHASFDDHENVEGEGKVLPHEFSMVACPHCDHTDPGSHTGRCADGVCSDCLGTGVRDPSNDAHIHDGHGDHEGKRHHRHEGGTFGDEVDLNNAMKEMMSLEQAEPDASSPLGFQAFRDAIASGRALPPTTSEIIRALNRERYEQRDRDKTMAELQRERLERSRETGMGALGRPLPRAPEPLFGFDLNPEERPGIDQILPPVEKNTALMEAYHSHHLKERMEFLLKRALNQGNITEEQADEFRQRFNESPHFTTGHNKRNHEVQDFLSELQRAAESNIKGQGAMISFTDQFGEDRRKRTGFPRYDPKMDTGSLLYLYGEGEQFKDMKKFRRGAYEPLQYHHGRFLTARERDENIFHPNDELREHPEVGDQSIKHLFRHNRTALNAYEKAKTAQDPAKAQSVLDRLKELETSKTPIMEKRSIENARSPMLVGLLKEMGYDVDEYFKQTGMPTSTEGFHPTWTDAAKRKTKGEERNTFFKHPTEVDEQGKPLNLDHNFAEARKRMEKEQAREYAKHMLIKTMLERVNELDGTGMLYQRLYGADGAVPRFYQQQGKTFEQGDRLDISDYKAFRETSDMHSEILDSAIEHLLSHAGIEDETGFDKNFGMNRVLRVVGGDDPDNLTMIFSPNNFKNNLYFEPRTNEPRSEVEIKTKRHKMPATLNQLIQKGYEAQQESVQIASAMKSMAMHYYYPNYMREQALHNTLQELGLDSAEDLNTMVTGMKNSGREEEAQQLVAKVRYAENLNRFFHPNFQPMRHDDLNTFDAVQKEEHNRLQQYGRQESAVRQEREQQLPRFMTQMFGSPMVQPTMPQMPPKPQPVQDVAEVGRPQPTFMQQNPQDSS